MKNLWLIIILLLPIECVNAQDWTGHGQGLSYLEMSEGIAQGFDCEYFFQFHYCELSEGKHDVTVIDPETGIFQYKYQIEVHGTNIDSISIFSKSGNLVRTYYNDRLYPKKNKSRYRSIQLNIHDFNDYLVRRIEILETPFTRELTIYVHNEKLEKTNEVKLSKEETDTLQKIIAKIDLESNNKSYGVFGISHAPTFTFIFHRRDEIINNYSTQRLPRPLAELKSFMSKLTGNN